MKGPHPRLSKRFYGIDHNLPGLRKRNNRHFAVGSEPGSLLSIVRSAQRLRAVNPWFRKGFLEISRRFNPSSCSLSCGPGDQKAPFRILRADGSTGSMTNPWSSWHGNTTVSSPTSSRDLSPSTSIPLKDPRSSIWGLEKPCSRFPVDSYHPAALRVADQVAEGLHPGFP